jgi:hypothetical protein
VAELVETARRRGVLSEGGWKFGLRSRLTDTLSPVQAGGTGGRTPQPCVADVGTLGEGHWWLPAGLMQYGSAKLVSGL